MGSLKHSKHVSDQERRDVRILEALFVLVLAFALFALGFLVRGYDPLMERLGVNSVSVPAPVASNASMQVSDVANHLSEVMSIISSDSVDSYDESSATNAVLGAFLESTGDSYARYYDADRYSAYVDSSSSDYPGVGVFFSEYNGKAYALDVFEGSSAAEAGVKPGDFVVAIDGDSSQDWSATEAINAVQRESGSTVVIRWRHAESLDSTGGEEFTTTLTTGNYEEPNVTTQLTNKVGYISLKQFTSNSDALVREAISELTDEGARSFVLDLRDNPGGYLSKSVDVASLFIKSGTVVEIDTLTTSTTREVSGDLATEAPLVVLVNGNTAGSAEALAAALRDLDRAAIVGTTTMGKGSVQVTRPLSFGGALRYTAARYVSPSGYAIDGVGVSPDASVAMDSDSSTDRQKEVAVETAQSLIKN